MKKEIVIQEENRRKNLERKTKLKYTKAGIAFVIIAALTIISGAWAIVLQINKDNIKERENSDMAQTITILNKKIDTYDSTLKNSVSWIKDSLSKHGIILNDTNRQITVLKNVNSPTYNQSNLSNDGFDFVKAQFNGGGKMYNIHLKDNKYIKVVAPK